MGPDVAYSVFKGQDTVFKGPETALEGYETGIRGPKFEVQEVLRGLYIPGRFWA